jgi:hypothetical protein
MLGVKAGNPPRRAALAGVRSSNAQRRDAMKTVGAISAVSLGLALLMIALFSWYIRAHFPGSDPTILAEIARERTIRLY